MYAQRRFRREHKGTDIKRGFRFRGNPVFFHFHQFFHRFYEHINRNGRHTESFVGFDHTFRVHLRTEQLNLSLFRPVSFHSFKGFLCVMQRHAGRIQKHRFMGHDSGIMPLLFSVPVHHKHIICHVLSKSQILLIRFFFQMLSFFKSDIHNTVSSLGFSVIPFFLNYSIKLQNLSVNRIL